MLDVSDVYTRHMKAQGLCHISHTAAHMKDP